jgi:hypothetical protein
MVVLADEPLRNRYYWYAIGAAAMAIPYLVLTIGIFLLTLY